MFVEVQGFRLPDMELQAFMIYVSSGFRILVHTVLEIWGLGLQFESHTYYWKSFRAFLL